VGGLPVNGGGVIRCRTLLRSGSLRGLSPEDAASLLTEWDLRTVVDLRTPAELAADGPTRLADAGIATAHLPLMTDADIAVSRILTDDDAVEALGEAYNSFVDRRGGHILTAARLLAWSADGSLLIHCSAGKDRTGVTIAILLDAVGVRREAIIDDYARTNDVIDDVLDALARSPRSSISLEAIPLAARRAQPDALRTVLDRLDRDFGGAAEWLRAKGLEPAELARLRRRLVAEPHAA
jgi:protein tyrosine/serine phosphatase